MLQKLHSRKFTPSPQINSLSNITYYINDFRCLIILKSIILRKYPNFTVSPTTKRPESGFPIPTAFL